VLDDLGAQGELPPNQPLLDWLACEFRDHGWDVKHLVRLIVTSHAYRQTSVASAELLAADPENREIARQSPFRIDAELVRDNALAISGLLVPRIGGPSAKADFYGDFDNPGTQGAQWVFSDGHAALIKGAVAATFFTDDATKPTSITAVDPFRDQYVYTMD
jgi:hypothetical protein